MKIAKWFKSGIGVKRWVVIGILGLFSFALGVSPIINRLFLDNVTTTGYVIVTMVGAGAIFVAIRQGLISLLSLINEYKYQVDISRSSVNDMLYKKRILNRGPKVVIIGGGTGLSILLRGLKKYTSNITAVVTVADDGGGSGVLREDLGMLPPGDIRSCILALADTEPTMERLLQYRFTEGQLKGQSFGNLFIAAMHGIYDNFEMAIKEMSSVLAVTGKVLPMTLEDVKLYAKLENGQVIEGESNIPEENKALGSTIDKVYIQPENSYPLEETLRAIKDADVVVLGPGSLYTSVIPNLLVKGMVDTIHGSKAIKVYVPNVMTQPGETDGYNVHDHVEAILKHTDKNIIDYVVANRETIPRSTLKKYAEDGAKPVTISKEQEQHLKRKNIRVIKDHLIEVKSNYIRHDALMVSQVIMDLVLVTKVKGDRWDLSDGNRG